MPNIITNQKICIFKKYDLLICEKCIKCCLGEERAKFYFKREENK